MDTKEFIDRARKIHGDKYDYSKVEYINYNEKVCIICHEVNENGIEHGEFWQTPHSHLNGSGCKKCYDNRRYLNTLSNTEDFIQKANKKHDNKYDYSKVNYVNHKTKVCIICPEHGEFWQTPTNHLSGDGCPKCAQANLKKINALSTDEFIEKARKIHGEKYDYSKVNYVNYNTKVCIICPEHGEFWQMPSMHLSGAECYKCSRKTAKIKITKTPEEFIKDAKEVHGDKYDYSKTKYKTNKDKVCIICHKKDECGIEHGEFWQTPSKHLNGSNCPKCNGKYRSKESYIKAFNQIHKDKYDYSKFSPTKSHEKSCIICHEVDEDGIEHGEFYQTPLNHLNGQGCPKCKAKHSHERYCSNNEEFIKKARQIHGDKYDYSRVKYYNNHCKIEIICHELDENGLEHGSFFQTPNTHLTSSGCPKCSAKRLHERFVKTTEQFIEEAKEVHGDKYDYSKTKYINNKNKVEIICPIHGSFWQHPNSHLYGRGCPMCNESHLEEEIELSLKGETEIIRNKRYKWLGRKTLDFYLPEYNAAIECQGIQHFKESPFFDCHDPYINRLKRDTVKKKLCEEHGVKLYYFSHEEFNEFLGEKVYHDKDELLTEIFKLNQKQML